jgi:O-antigen/teichoic acid export membrane protein
LLAAASYPLAFVLKDMRLVPVFCCFALSLPLFPASTVCGSLLDRNLDQKRAQAANVSSYALGYCGIGIPATLLGCGAWSPIIGFFAQLLIKTALLWHYTRADLRPLWGVTARTKPLSTFGLRVMLTNVSNWLIYSMDNLLVQRFFGTRQFALYSVAYSVVRTPSDHLVQTFQNVLLPASSRIKDDKERLGRSYIAVLDAVSTVAIPMFATVAAIAPTFTEAIYGSRWSGAEMVLTPLALAMPFQAGTMVTSALLWGSGYVEKELRIQRLCAAMLFVTIILCARWSFVAVAWGVLAVYLMRASMIAGVFSALVGLRPRQIADALRAGVGLAVLIVPSAMILDRVLRSHDSKPLTSLLMEGSMAAFLWLGMLAATRGRILSGALQGVAGRVLAQLLPRWQFWAHRRAP